MSISEKAQQITPGFYYHYKHDPSVDIYNRAFEVLGVGSHTEIDGEEGLMVIYRPMYESFVYKNGLIADVRPLEMFLELRIVDGVSSERFTPITDVEVVKKLEEKRDEMYR